MNRTNWIEFVPFYLLVVILTIGIAAGGSHAVTVWSENIPLGRSCRIIIDAGHGGVDGGATSVTGVLESQINLQIALRLEDLMHLLGYETVMIRREDISIHTQGETIAAKKVSDLKERARIVRETEDALLVSIHQNYFPQEKYSGAQVFYSNSDESRILAKNLQEALVKTLNPGSKRMAKKAEGVYLMEHIDCPGVLVECGFLSNYKEEELLRTPVYQKKLCAVIASAVSTFLNT